MNQHLDELAPSLNAYFTDQFNNEHHSEGYHRLGSEILADCPSISDFVMGVGTGGCTVGATAGIRAEGG